MWSGSPFLFIRDWSPNWKVHWEIDLPTEKSIGRLISQLKSPLGDLSAKYKVDCQVDLPTEKSIGRSISQLKSPFEDWLSGLPEKAVRETLACRLPSQSLSPGSDCQIEKKVYYGVWEMKLRPAGKVQADRENAKLIRTF